jgi:hypothetical protein
MTIILLLGVVHDPTSIHPSRGQRFRDRVRCDSLIQLGHQVFTLDDKHDDTRLPTHCQANFSNPRRMLASVFRRWGHNIRFDQIHLDYFFSPVGWARTRWNIAFFRDTLPALTSLLSPSGSIWLPYNLVVHDMIANFAHLLQNHFTSHLIHNPFDSLLFLATQRVQQQLERCPDNITNATQLPHLLHTPFLVLSTWS